MSLSSPSVTRFNLTMGVWPTALVMSLSAPRIMARRLLAAGRRSDKVDASHHVPGKGSRSFPPTSKARWGPPYPDPLEPPSPPCRFGPGVLFSDTPSLEPVAIHLSAQSREAGKARWGPISRSTPSLEPVAIHLVEQP